jgi:hypothetical protein
MRPELGRAVEDAVDEDLEIRPHLGDQVADHPERMVRDHHDRPCWRHRLQPRRIVVGLEPEMADRRSKEALDGTRPAPGLEIEALQAALAGQALDGADGEPAQSRIVR